MRQGKLFCAWWTIFIFPLLLSLLAFAVQWRDIEADVQANAEEALSNSQYDWAEATTFNRGRNVLITGSADSQTEINEAIAIVENTWGVNKGNVKHNGEPIIPPVLSDPELEFNFQEQQILLKGRLANHTQLDDVINRVRGAFPSRTINNQLSVADKLAEFDDFQFIDVITNAAQASNGMGAKVTGKQISLIGSVHTPTVRQQLAGWLNGNFSIDNQLKIVQPAVERDQCVDMMNNLLRDSKINFESGKAQISLSSQPLLNQITATAERCQDVQFEVSGHTDSIGRAQANLTLSQQRAEAVVHYLVQKGLSSERFDAKGYGDTQPIASNDTNDGRATNRRIEFRLKNN